MSIGLSAYITKSGSDAAYAWKFLSPFLFKSSTAPEEFTVSGGPVLKKALGRQESDLNPEEIAELINKFPDERISLCGMGPTSRKLFLTEWTDEINIRSVMLAGSYSEMAGEMKHVANALWKWPEPPIIAYTRLGTYRAWQSYSDPEGYKRYYGSIDGFKIVPSGPPPVDFPSLDTSMNPGRNIRIDRFAFAVSADMWLGPRFWEFAPCKKDEVMAADFFLEKRESPDCLYLKSWHHPFTRPDGEQGRIQQKLWRLLFHEDCEWPPGSGGISDEPIGGPPEFMPPGILD